MSDKTATLLLAILTALAGLALYRLIGPTAGGATGAALISLFQTFRRRRREERRRLVAEVRAEDPANRKQVLQDIPDAAVRRAVAIDVQREGDVASEGNIEQFPFPASFIRFANRTFWLRWISAAMLFGVAALVPLSIVWRLAAFLLGLIAVYGVWRATHLERMLQTVIEISPSEIAEVWPDGSRFGLHLAQGLGIEIAADGESFWIIAPSSAMIHISKHRLAFRRLSVLCERYTGIRLPHLEAAT